MLTSGITKSSASNENPLSQEPSYFEKFGEGPPLEIRRFAANSGQSSKMHEMLQEHVRKGEPVTDWDAFVRPLYEASGVNVLGRERISGSTMLKNSEQERLRQDLKTAADYGQKAFKKNPPSR